MDFFKTFACYPPEYNRAKHGPYYPWKYYGPKDANFKDVKLGELVSWFGRRDYSPRGISNAISRSYHLWAHKWVRPLRSNGAPLYQFMVAYFVLSYAATYHRVHSHHSHRKHH